MLITAVGDAIHDDFYSVEGAGLTDDVVLEFGTPLGVVVVIPQFIRPHLALVDRLPSSIPVGTADLRLVSSSGSASNVLSITVSGGSPQAVRLLQAGEAKSQPYTIAFVGNPGIEAAVGATFSADHVLMNRHGYQSVVAYCFRNLFGGAEDLFQKHTIESRIRLISIFDPTRLADPTTSLAHEIPQSDVMETRRSVLVPFLAAYGITADVVFVIHGSTTHHRASAWFTTDDTSLAGTPYTLDGPRIHSHFPRIPGSAAIPVVVDRTGLTIIHEFGHAASDFKNGKIIDLYNDRGDGTGFVINKRFRAAAGTAIPQRFASYNGVHFDADSARDSLGYPGNWRSYQAAAIDPNRPNLMDDYWQNSDPQLCRFDQFTYRWLQDRLHAKLSRV
jgi:hypothetical protein